MGRGHIKPGISSQMGKLKNHPGYRTGGGGKLMERTLHSPPRAVRVLTNEKQKRTLKASPKQKGERGERGALGAKKNGQKISARRSLPRAEFDGER